MPVLSGNLRKALAGCPPPTHVCGCFAGLLTAKERKDAIGLLQSHFPGAAIRAEPDYAAAFMACPKGTDICVIAGTGSLVCSRSGQTFLKSGGRGYVMGDYGAAYRYGRETLRYHLEEETLTEIEGDLVEVFGSCVETEVLANLYRSGPIAGKLARLAPVFAREASAGEPSALDFLQSETNRLAQQVVTHAERHLVEKTDLTVCLAGGLWKISPMFEGELSSRLKDISGGRNILTTKIKEAPVEGAVLLAQELLS
jgi:N-acetylglucosamine kinase-like BadF-type ATPase